MDEKQLKEMTSKVMSELAKKSHKKSPRGKKFYQDMVNKRWAKKK